MAKFDLVDYLMGKNLRNFRLRDTEATASCPFHSDSSPSFSINVKTGAWLCRASNTCGKKGGLVALVAKLEKVSFKEAAKIAQVRAPLYSEADFDALIHGVHKTKKNATCSPLPACQSATEFYPEYLEKRRYLKNSGVAEAYGLMVGCRDVRDLYRGRFADYLIMPIFDRDSKYLSFTARYMGTDPGRLRYDGPSDPLKDFLYGEWQLSDSTAPIYVVEGQFDVMRLWTFGEDALGTLGTTYTNKQVLRLSKLAGTRPIVIAYDMDTINRKNPDMLEVETMHSTPMKLASMLMSMGSDCKMLDIGRSGVKDVDLLHSVDDWVRARDSA